MTELSSEQRIELTQKGIDAAVDAGAYIALDDQLEYLLELGQEISPLDGLNLRIAAREKYAQVASKDEIFANEGFENELEDLKRQREELLSSQS